MGQDRKEFIGGSDIAAVMGLSPWKTPLQLFLEKTGQVDQADLSDNEAVQLGSELEDFVAKKFSRVTGKDVRRAPCYYTDKEYPFMKCQVDRLVTGTDELLECKTASLRKESEWRDDEVPAHYILQVQWQLMITGRSLAYIACLIGGQRFVHKKIQADNALQKTMRDRAVDFWVNYVQKNVAPMAMLGDDEALLALHPRNNEEIQLVESMDTAIARRQELSMHIEQMKEEKELIEVKIKECCGDNLGIKTSRYLATWKEQKRSGVDVEALKKDGIYDFYLKESKTRVLRVSLNKQGGK